MGYIHFAAIIWQFPCLPMIYMKSIYIVYKWYLVVVIVQSSLAYFVILHIAWELYLRALPKSFWLHTFCCSFLITYLYINNINKRYQLYASVTYHDCCCLSYDDAVTLVTVWWTTLNCSYPYSSFTLRATLLFIITIHIPYHFFLIYLFHPIPFSSTLISSSSITSLSSLPHFLSHLVLFFWCVVQVLVAHYFWTCANNEVRVSWALDSFLRWSFYITYLSIYQIVFRYAIQVFVIRCSWTRANDEVRVSC